MSILVPTRMYLHAFETLQFLMEHNSKLEIMVTMSLCFHTTLLYKSVTCERHTSILCLVPCLEGQADIKYGSPCYKRHTSIRASWFLDPQILQWTASVRTYLSGYNLVSKIGTVHLEICDT